jgi:hypothetical protein
MQVAGAVNLGNVAAIELDNREPQPENVNQGLLRQRLGSSDSREVLGRGIQRINRGLAVNIADFDGDEGLVVLKCRHCDFSLAVGRDRQIRPTPAQISARKWEIEQRYKRKVGKVGKRTRSMAAIRLAELTRWLEACHGSVLEPSDESLMVIRIFAHHMAGLPDMPRRVTNWIDRHAPWLSIASKERLISECAAVPLKWSADKLAWKLRLTDQLRTRLKITTIGAIDCNRDQRAARRKAKRKERDAARYQAKRCSPTI